MFEYQNLKPYIYFLFLNVLNIWIPSCGIYWSSQKNWNDLVNMDKEKRFLKQKKPLVHMFFLSVLNI